MDSVGTAQNRLRVAPQPPPRQPAARQGQQRQYRDRTGKVQRQPHRRLHAQQQSHRQQTQHAAVPQRHGPNARRRIAPERPQPEYARQPRQTQRQTNPPPFHRRSASTHPEQRARRRDIQQLRR
jgi:hypothetical protein